MKKKYALYVEDSLDDIQLMRWLWEKAHFGYELVIANDGEEAIKILVESDAAGSEDDLPHMIVLDNKMPNMTGLEVLRRVRSEARTKKLPVVMISQSVTEDDIAEAYRLGANDFIPKCANFNQFVQTIMPVIEYWLSSATRA